MPNRCSRLCCFHLLIPSPFRATVRTGPGVPGPYLSSRMRFTCRAQARAQSALSSTSMLMPSSKIGGALDMCAFHASFCCSYVSMTVFPGSFGTRMIADSSRSSVLVYFSRNDTPLLLTAMTRTSSLSMSIFFSTPTFFTSANRTIQKACTYQKFHVSDRRQR